MNVLRIRTYQNLLMWHNHLIFRVSRSVLDEEKDEPSGVKIHLNTVLNEIKVILKRC